jgi:hypothetical protein
VLPTQHQLWGQQPSQTTNFYDSRYDLAPNMGAGSWRTDDLSVQEREHLAFPEEVEETLGVRESSEGGEGGEGGEFHPEGETQMEGEEMQEEMQEEIQVEEDPQLDEVVGHQDGDHELVIRDTKFYVDESGRLKKTLWILN